MDEKTVSFRFNVNENKKGNIVEKVEFNKRSNEVEVTVGNQFDPRSSIASRTRFIQQYKKMSGVDDLNLSDTRIKQGLKSMREFGDSSRMVVDKDINKNPDWR